MSYRGMDVSVPCTHCGVEVGQFCIETCVVNGKRICKLEDILKELGFDGVKSIQLKDRPWEKS